MFIAAIVFLGQAVFGAEPERSRGFVLTDISNEPG